MFCTQCGNALSIGGNFCNKCGASVQSYQSSNPERYQLEGYWLCESSTHPNFAQLRQDGMEMVTQYLVDGTGVGYVTGRSLIAQGEGLLYLEHPFTWMHDGLGKITVNSKDADGKFVKLSAAYQIAGQVLTMTFDDGNTSVDKKLPNDFSIPLTENSDLGGNSTVKTVGKLAGSFLLGLVEGFLEEEEY